MKGLLKRSRRPVEERAGNRNPATLTVDGLARQFQAMYGDGTGITVEQAVRQAAVWACVRVLTTSASTLPVDGVRMSGASRTPVTPTPTILADPAGTVDLPVWLTQVFWSLNTDGNAFGRVAGYGGNGLPNKIETILPSTVKDRGVVDGRGQVKIDGEVRYLFPYGTIWHVPGMIVQPGTPFGMSPVEVASKSINTALTAEEFGYGFLADGGHPSALLYSENEETPETARRIKQAFLRATEGREPAVLGAGLKYEAVQVDPTDSQFIDLMRFETENVCRFFGVPPSMVYAAVSGQSVTYANVSQADLAYLKHSLDPLLVRVESALTKLLPKPQVAKFNRGALLRADQQTRYAMYATALQNQFTSVDEVRALEDEPPYGGEFAQPGIPGGAAPTPTMEAPADGSP